MSTQNPHTNVFQQLLLRITSSIPSRRHAGINSKRIHLSCAACLCRLHCTEEEVRQILSPLHPMSKVRDSQVGFLASSSFNIFALGETENATILIPGLKDGSSRIAAMEPSSQIINPPESFPEFLNPRMLWTKAVCRRRNPDFRQSFF